MYNQLSLQTGNKPLGIALADFNGDGRLDLAVANANDNTVSVMNVRADGTFAPKVDYAVGTTPVALTTVDVNDDHKMDIVVVNSADNTMSILLGAGDGTFQVQPSIPTGPSPIAIVAGEFNGDGHMDLAVANQAGNSVSILLGTGNATFTSQSPIPTNGMPFSILSGDWNNDGETDLVVLTAVTNSSNTVSLLTNNGNGTFNATRLGEGGDAMALGDFNGDGYLDVALTNPTTESVVILFGNGVGISSQSTLVTSNSLGTPPRSIAIGDFNHDGKMDIAVTETYFISVYLGNGDGTFGSPLNGGIPSFTAPLSLVVADVNNDALLDLAILIPDYDVALVLLGNGDGTFASRTDISLPGSGGIGGSAIADFTGDRKPDVAVAQFNQPATSPIQGFLTVLPNNGNETFRQPLTGPNGDIGIGDMVSADFNGDGNTDIAAAAVNANGGIAVFLGNGTGGFGQPIDSFTGLTGLNIQPIAAGDFNRDGKADLIVVSENDGATNSSPMYILLGQGDGTFKQHLLYNLAYGFVASIATTDFNHDGFLDLAVTTDNALLVFLGRGDGTFQSPTSYPIKSSFVNSVAVGDFNGGGVPDIIVGVSGGIWFYAGKGDGTFQVPVFTQNALTMSTLFARDFNGDGILDLATKGPSLSHSILLGNGDGTFQQPSPFEATYYPRGYTVGDLNSDGAADLVQFSSNSILSASSQTATIWYSTSTLTFTTDSLRFASQNVGTSSSPEPISLSNAGNATFSLADIAAHGDFSQTNTCANTLAIGEGCTIEVTFKPTASGPRTGSITVAGNGKLTKQTLTLIGWAGPPDFISTASPASQVVKAGSSVTYSLVLASGDGFAGAVQVTCMGAPAKASCTPSSSSITLNANGTSKVRVTVTTTAASLAALSLPISQIGRISRRSPSVSMLWLVVFCFFVALAFLTRRRVLRLVPVIPLLLLSVSCGGGGTGTPGGPNIIPGTPAGTYNLILTTMSGNSTHTTTVTLIVQ